MTHTETLEKQNLNGSNHCHCGPTTANPAPLGLLCFAMTIVLLGLYHTQVVEMSTILWMMGFFCAGLGQFVVGIMEWKKGNSFGTTAFTAYGIFWFTFIGSHLLNAYEVGTPPTQATLCAFLIIWGAFTFLLYLISLRLDKKIQSVFFTLTIAFFLLAFYDYNPEIKSVRFLAGLVCILCGGLSAYAAMSQLCMEYYCCSKK